MQEPEVSIRIALYYIKNGYTKENVRVSIDGAHIKTGERVHFDIINFMSDNGCEKCDGDHFRWQGEYAVDGFEPKIIISSTPGVGDVNIKLSDGKTLYIESKKIRKGKSNNEYPAMREAIGQLMTANAFGKNVVPAVAVPYSPKSFELAHRWSQFEQIKNAGIRFILVSENGNIRVI